MTKDKNIIKNKKNKIYKPLSGSFAKVCTEFSMPDLTRKVPHTLNVKVDMHKIIDHDAKDDLFSKTRIQ